MPRTVCSHALIRPAVAFVTAVLFMILPAWSPSAAAAGSLARVPPAAGEPANGARASDAHIESPASWGPALQENASPLPELLRFEHINNQDGLSQETVFFIQQDRQGFLWVGTQGGLNRYDGNRFTVFRNNPADSNSISHDVVLCMQEDADGMLWFGTWGGGLNRYDPRTGLFTRYRHAPLVPTSLSNDTVTALAQDSSGRLWVGTLGGGVNILNPPTGEFRHYRADINDADALASDYISAILPDPSGKVWIGTGSLGVDGRGLDRFDPRTGKAIHYQFKPYDPNSLSSDTVSALALDANGMLWVATGGYNLQGRGLNRLDTSTGEVTRYQHNLYYSNSLASNDLMSLYIDRSGTLWIGTWGSGLDRLDTRAKTPSFLHYLHDPYDLYSLSGNNIWSIFEDRTGVLWFGSTIGGLNKVNPLAQRFHLYRNNPAQPKSLAGNAVGPMLEDRAGNLWVGTLGAGLDRFNREDGSFTHFQTAHYHARYQQTNTYSALMEDHTGTIWVGTQAGLARFDPASGGFAYYYHDAVNPASLSSDQVTDLAEDASGRLWVSTDAGLDWFDRDSKQFIHMAIPGAGPGTDLFIDRSGKMWLGTMGTGVFELDINRVAGTSMPFTWYRNIPDQPETLSDNTIVDIYSDSQGVLWFATGRGLDNFDAQNQEFIHYRVENGLASNSVFCTVEDDQGRLWISTNSGITRFDRKNGQFRTFDARDGLQGSEFSARSCMRSKTGEMYFGGTSGLSAFQPDEIQDNPYPPPVAVTSFRIYNQPAAVDLSGNTPISLSYQQDFITFEFVALDFHIPQKNQLAYRLDGFDKDWVKADIGHYASYTNLSGGSYVFRVRGSNNDGVWNEQEVAIPIQVATPFWETNWFRVMGVILFALIVVLGVRAYLMNIRVQNRRLEELVELRTTTLRQTNERLHQEIVQREKVEAALAQKAAEEAVAAERSRLARDLHDAVTQTLFSASLTAEVLPDLWQVNPDEAQRSTEDLRQLTRGALAEMRTLLLELRPAALTQARYEDLLRQLTDAVIGRARLPVELRITGQRSLPPEVQVALYRIAQETLNNIVKYAKATRVCIDLQMSQAGLLLSMQDDGVGFDTAGVRPTSLGMRIMRERAEGIGADLSILSTPGKGTLVEVAWNDRKTKELE